MGEVFRARDTRLDRDVAIKVLPREFAGDAQLKARFAREAKAISALTHPHICVLYDIGSDDGVEYLVMELVQGETLADRLQRGALRLDEALRYAVDIASALAHAHEAGITHRDLKPGNIMITKAGAKVLDFGLAKFTAAAETTRIPGARPLTEEGTVLGTLQYMAPEQIDGREADARTDVFALGAVLYEMVTGRRAFEGPSQVSLIAAIMEKEPLPLMTIQPMAPAALDRVISICLAKNPEERFQSARDIALELQWIARERSDSSVQGVTPKRRRRGALAWTIATASMIIAIATGVIAVREQRTIPPRPFRRLGITVPDVSLMENPEPFAVSPDGKSIVYMSRGPASSFSQLRLFHFDGRAPAVIAGTEEGGFPFFSADSESIAFAQDRYLKKVNLRSGAITTICPASTVRGGVWMKDDTIVFAAGIADPLSRVPAAGGLATPVTHLQASKGERGHSRPDLLPDGDHVLFTVMHADHPTIEAVSLSTGRRTPIMAGTRARYDGRGHLIVAIGDSIQAIDFDPRSLRVSGRSVPIASDLFSYDPFAIAPFAVLPDGAILYRPRNEARRNLATVDRKGVVHTITSIPRSFGIAHYSPDGKRIITEDDDSNLWLCEVQQGSCTRNIADGQSAEPIWSSDGAAVIFSCGPGAHADLCMQSADGGTVKHIVRNTGKWSAPRPFVMSPDGHRVLYGTQDSRRGWDVDMATLGPTVQIAPLLATENYEGYPTISPDGRWMAYVTNASGRLEIAVQAFPVAGRVWQISSEGGDTPVWSRRGDEIFFSSGQTMMVASVKTQPSFSAQAPRRLFDYGSHVGSFDVAPDGQHFLMARDAVDNKPIAPFVLIEGALDQLAAH